MQLDASALRDSGDAAGETAREPGEHQFDRRRRKIVGGELLGMIGLDGEGLVAALLGAEAEEAVDLRAAVRAVDPVARRAPLELRGLRRLLQRFAGAEKCVDINAIVDLG